LDNNWLVDKVEFIGNSIDDKKLVDIMHLKPSSKGRKTIFNFIDMVEDLGILRSFYKSKGYVDAKVTLQDVVFDSLSHSVDIHIKISEGKPVRIRTVRFEIVKIQLDTIELLREMELIGEPADSALIHDGSLIIAQRLAMQGFWLSEIKTGIMIDTADNTASVVYFITTGPIIITGELYYYGLNNISQSLVKTVITLHENEVLSLSSIIEAERRLNETELFSRVEVKPVFVPGITSELQDTVEVPVVIDVDEKSVWLINGGGGYDSYNKWFLTFTTGYKNLFSKGHRLTADISVSKPENKIHLNYYYPYVLQRPHFLNVALFYEQQNQINFSGTFLGGHATFRENLSRSFITGQRLRIENVQSLKSKNSTTPIERKSTVALASIITKSTRQSSFDPGNTFYFSLFTEIAGPGLKWTNQFYKWEVDLRMYQAGFKKKMTAASALFVGNVDKYIKSELYIPVNELYRPGFNGTRPVRGYTLDELIDGNTKIENGGKCVVVLNIIDIRLNIYKWIYGELFVDSGKMWSSLSYFSFQDMKWAAGPGLLGNFSFGIFRLEYAIHLKSNPKGRILFSAGLPF
jgi:outer membrane protein assembly factor BamA